MEAFLASLLETPINFPGLANLTNKKSYLLCCEGTPLWLLIAERRTTCSPSQLLTIASQILLTSKDYLLILKTDYKVSDVD